MTSLYLISQCALMDSNSLYHFDPLSSQIVESWLSMKPEILCLETPSLMVKFELIVMSLLVRSNFEKKNQRVSVMVTSLLVTMVV